MQRMNVCLNKGCANLVVSERHTRQFRNSADQTPFARRVIMAMIAVTL
jgi:hypothetical protein